MEDHAAIAAAAIASDPVAAHAFNPAQLRFFDLVKNPAPSLTIVEFLKGNGLGGSWSLIALWKAIMWGTKNKNLQGSPFGNLWPFMKSARLVTTAESLSDVGPIQKAMRMLFPFGRWSQTRGSGKGYYSQGKTDTGWDWDVMTYNQDVSEFASHTKGLILLSEPPPEPVFEEVVSRLRGNGMVLVDMTQLDEASWNTDIVENGLRINGKDIGAEVRHTYGHHHEACKEHNAGGHRTHASIDADYALWLKFGKAHADARASGHSVEMAGRIYPNWQQEVHELADWTEYQRECLDKEQVRVASVVDPHDRKPWACTWWACFPNEDVVCFAEWPNFPFHKADSSPISDIEAYRDVLLETEAHIERRVDMRWVDGKFGAAIKSGRGLNVVQMLTAPCVGCEEAHGKDKAVSECRHRLSYKLAPAYKGSVRDGHILVRSQIGENGSRPKMYALREYTPNFCYGMRHYGWNPKSKDSDGKPELMHKDFPDTARMLLLSKCHIWPAEPTPTKIIPHRPR